MKREKSEIIVKIAEAIEITTMGVISSKQVKPGDRLIDDLGLDSLGYATIMLSVETWLGVNVMEDHVDWREIKTVEQLAKLMESQQ